jgi:hypothetical protein
MREQRPTEPGDVVVRLTPAVPKTGTSDAQNERMLCSEW